MATLADPRADQDDSREPWPEREPGSDSMRESAPGRESSRRERGPELVSPAPARGLSRVLGFVVRLGDGRGSITGFAWLALATASASRHSPQVDHFRVVVCRSVSKFHVPLADRAG